MPAGTKGFKLARRLYPCEPYFNGTCSSEPGSYGKCVCAPGFSDPACLIECGTLHGVRVSGAEDATFGVTVGRWPRARCTSAVASLTSRARTVRVCGHHGDECDYMWTGPTCSHPARTRTTRRTGYASSKTLPIPTTAADRRGRVREGGRVCRRSRFSSSPARRAAVATARCRASTASTARVRTTAAASATTGTCGRGPWLRLRTSARGNPSARFRSSYTDRSTRRGTTRARRSIRAT